MSDSSSNITEEPIVSVIQALFNLRCVSAIKFRGIMGIISVKASQILNALCKRASHRKAPGTAAEKPQQTTAKSHVAKSKHVRLLTCRCLRIGFVASGLVRKSSVLWMRHIEDVHPMRLHAHKATRPSGTLMSLKTILRNSSGQDVDMCSSRFDVLARSRQKCTQLRSSRPTKTWSVTRQ